MRLAGIGVFSVSGGVFAAWRAFDAGGGRQGLRGKGKRRKKAEKGRAEQENESRGAKRPRFAGGEENRKPVGIPQGNGIDPGGRQAACLEV
jgi:hypothetical protein